MLHSYGNCYYLKLKECGCLQNNTVVFGDNAYYNTDRLMNERGVDMCSVAVKIPDEVLYDTKMTEAEANAFAKRATALMLYTQNHISIGYCAQIAGMVADCFRNLFYSGGCDYCRIDCIVGGKTTKLKAR